MSKFLKSKTVWAGVAGAVGWALKQPHLDVLTVVQALATIIGVLGVRDAIDKGPGTL